MTSPNHIMEDVEGHHLDPLLMMKAKVRNLHQDHLHQDHLTRATTTRATPTMITSIEATSTKTTATRTTCASITSTTGNPHRRSNLNRVQTKNHHLSNLRVIDRYDSSSLSIKGPNPTGLTL